MNWKMSNYKSLDKITVEIKPSLPTLSTAGNKNYNLKSSRVLQKIFGLMQE